MWKNFHLKWKFFDIQFSISTQLSSIWPIDRALLGVTTPGHSGPGSDGNEGILRIPPKLQHFWNLTIRLFSVISRTVIGGGEVLPLCREAVGVFYRPGLMGEEIKSWIKVKTFSSPCICFKKKGRALQKLVVYVLYFDVVRDFKL